MRTSLILAVAVAAATLATRAYADPGECRAASDSFLTRRADVFNAMQAYGHCVAANDGRDECRNQFWTLNSAQNDFENAVSDYRGDCRSS